MRGRIEEVNERISEELEKVRLQGGKPDLSYLSDAEITLCGQSLNSCLTISTSIKCLTEVLYFDDPESF